jgi:aspartyl-tRNA synthetase
MRVRVSGWLHNRRDLGGVLFVDLRDHYGVVQLVARPGAEAYELLTSLRKETVICVDGTVVPRGEVNVNPELPTGEVEIEVGAVEVLGTCDPLPFSVFPEEQTAEEKRLAYRFLDLRRAGPHRT